MPNTINWWDEDGVEGEPILLEDVVVFGVGINTDKLISAITGSLSISEAKRLREQGAIRINEEIITELKYFPTISEVKHGMGVRVGKKWFKVRGMDSA